MKPLSASMGSEQRILITTGDADGIGWEVTAKALQALGPKTGFQFFYYRHPDLSGPRTIKRFKTQVVASLDSAARVEFNEKTLIEIRSPKPPGLWVEESAAACMQGRFAALVTAPLSKTSIIASGLRDIGHTEILARISGASDLLMGFIGRKFSVVLATGHEPLTQAVRGLNETKLTKAIAAARGLRRILPPAKRKLPIALLGVNPHAGEEGLIGKEEIWFKNLVLRLGQRTEDLHGPLVPDAAFLPQNWKLYSVYVCPYHDQGLIPFKLVHGFESGVHLTLGLPFVRTSVDHGTAKDLFGKNRAEPGSMKDAILTAMRLSKESCK
jgi:4-hydroxythreonine-4-phosphate dehydrogenase